LTRKSFTIKKLDINNSVVVTPMVGMEVEVNYNNDWKLGIIKEIISDTQVK